MKDVFITLCVLAVGAVLIAIPPLGIAVAILFGGLLLKKYVKERQSSRQAADDHRREQERRLNEDL